MPRRAMQIAAMTAVAAVFVCPVPRASVATVDADPTALAGQVAVALVVTSDGRTLFVAAQRLTPAALRLTARVCDASGCLAESGVRVGRIASESGQWHLDVVSTVLGDVRLAGPISPGAMASRGCSVRSGGLVVDVATEALDVAAVSWTGTAGGKPARSIRGPRCSVVHSLGVTTVAYAAAG